MRAQSSVVGRWTLLDRGPARRALTLSVYRSTFLARAHAQTLIVKRQLRASVKRILLRMRASRCEPACAEGRARCTLEVGSARSTFERTFGQGRLIYARSTLSGMPRGPAGWGPARPTIILSVQRSASLACTPVQTVSAHSQLRARMKRSLLQVRARRCKLACAVGCA